MGESLRTRLKRLVDSDTHGNTMIISVNDASLILELISEYKNKQDEIDQADEIYFDELAKLITEIAVLKKRLSNQIAVNRKLLNEKMN